MWLIRWVPAFGGHVTLEAPTDARAELAARCQQLLAAHGITDLKDLREMNSGW